MVKTGQLIEYFTAAGVLGVITIVMIWFQKKISDMEKDNKDQKNVLMVVTERLEAMYKAVPNVINNVKQLSVQLNDIDNNNNDTSEELEFIIEHEETIRQCIHELQRISKDNNVPVEKEIPQRFEYSEPEPVQQPTYKHRNRRSRNQYDDRKSHQYNERPRQRNRKRVEFDDEDYLDQNDKIQNEELEIMNARNRRRSGINH